VGYKPTHTVSPAQLLNSVTCWH